MQDNSKYPRIKKIHQFLEKITRFDKNVKIHCVLLSYGLLSTKIHYTSIYIFIYYLFQDNFKNAKIMKMQEVYQEIHTKQFLLFHFKLFSIGDSFEFNATRET